MQVGLKTAADIFGEQGKIPLRCEMARSSSFQGIGSFNITTAIVGTFFGWRAWHYDARGTTSSVRRSTSLAKTLLGGATNGRGASAIGWEDFGVIPLWEVWYECSNLPAGLNLDQNNIPGLIYGTPTAPGTNNVTVIMNTSGGTRTNTIRIIVR